jgi:organic hydroperoxide reductase OsmC/OhrA
MTTMTATLRSIPETGASVGWASGHTVVVDRPDGRAGGQGLGFNGGQLLALAIGGCLCNDLHYVAHAMGVRLASVGVDVTVTFAGDPLIATGASVRIAVEAAEEAVDVAEIVRQAQAISTVSNSIARGIPVSVSS